MGFLCVASGIRIYLIHLTIGVCGVAPKNFFLKMALYSDLPLNKATYDLLLGIFQFTENFGKAYKYTVGESLKKETIELLTLIYRNSTYKKLAV